MQTIFDRGHEIEDIVLDRMVEDGWQIYDRQREIIIPVPIDTEVPCYVVGHIDALGVPPVGANPADPEAHLFEHLVEVKGFGKSYMDSYRLHGLNARYKVQVGSYCVGIPTSTCAFAVYDKENDTYHVDFIENQVKEWELHTIVLAVEEMYRTGTLPSCTNEYPCPYYYLHDPKETPMPLDATQDTLVTSYLALSDQIKILTDARSMISNQLKDSINWVDGAPTSYDATGAVVVVTQNPQALDRPKIQQLLVDAELDPDDYLLPSTGWHLRINAKKS